MRFKIVCLIVYFQESSIYRLWKTTNLGKIKHPLKNVYVEKIIFYVNLSRLVIFYFKVGIHLKVYKSTSIRWYSNNIEFNVNT